MNVYLPDEMADWVRDADLNASALFQAAIAAEQNRRSTSAWLASLPIEPPKSTHEDAMRALEEARAEMYGDDAEIYGEND